jgi:cyclase
MTMTRREANAHVDKWLEVCDRIQQMDVDVIVPGHGPIAGKKELAEMAGYFRLLQTEVKKRRLGTVSTGA